MARKITSLLTEIKDIVNNDNADYNEKLESINYQIARFDNDNEDTIHDYFANHFYTRESDISADADNGLTKKSLSVLKKNPDITIFIKGADGGLHSVDDAEWAEPVEGALALLVADITTRSKKKDR